MALKLTTSRTDLPQAGDTIYVYHANTSVLVSDLISADGSGSSLSNPFVVPTGANWYGFELTVNVNVDVWWEEENDYVIRDMNITNPNSLTDPFPQYILEGNETDPIFTEWDKSTGIQIALDQVDDWDDYQEELVSGTNIKTINGESILGSGDLIVYGDPLDETDPIFTAWDKSTGISITESQISDFGPYQESLLSTYNIRTINGESLLGYGNLVVEAEETDPIFSAWDRSTGITIYESQIIDFYPQQYIDLMEEEGSENLQTEDGELDLGLSGFYQDRLINEENIKSINGVSVLGNGNLDKEDFLFEIDPVFTAWDKSTGINIRESQITDLGTYHYELISGTNIKTINGESILGAGDITVDFSSFTESDPIFSAWDKTTGISIFENQVTDLDNYQEELTSGIDIKTINGQSVLGEGNLTIEFETGVESDPVFTAWDKSDGINIFESQISDLGNYEEQLVSGVDIKTINGESVLGSTPLYIYGEELTNSEIVTAIDTELGNTDWQSGTSASDVYIGDVVATHITTNPSWLLCDGSKLLVSEYPTLANMMEPEEPVGTGNNLFGWGYNSFGELGLSHLDHKSVPTQVGTNDDWGSVGCGGLHTIAIKTDGTLWAWGGNEYGQLGLNVEGGSSSPIQVGSLTDWQSVDGGEYHTVALKTDGTIWAWGRNNHGQLGTNDLTIYSSPVQVGSHTDWAVIDGGRQHTMAIKTDGTLWGWGSNTYGQLGQNNITNYSSPVQVGSLTDWQSVNCGGYHTLATKTDGTLWSWGSNDNGQLGLGDTVRRSSPVQVGSMTNWKKIATGWDHSVALVNDGRMYSWGLNNMGQLGLGDTTSRSEPTQVGAMNKWKDVSGGGYYFTLAVRELGTMWAWGYNIYGQLGLGNTAKYSEPTQVGTFSNWDKVTCGYRHVMAINTGIVEEFFLPNLPSIDNEKWYIKATN